MKLLTSILLALSMALSSCSSLYEASWERSIANEEVIAPLTAEELFTIKSTSSINKKTNNSTQFKSTVKYVLGIDGEYIEDPKIPNDLAFRIEPIIEDQKYKLRVYASEAAKNDQLAFAELLAVLRKFVGEFSTPTSLFELYYNAQLDDFPSLQAMAKIRKMSVTEPDDIAYWADINEKFDTQERIFNKKKKVKTQARKSIMDTLDKVSDDQQFRTLVAKNDRKGAAKLLRAYLPWEEMPPFEKLFWETHLAVMVDPLPIEDRVYIYRGINDDVIQMAQESGKMLSKENAIKEQKIFLMSTIMTKNQGTWNRRLRSLTAMYEKHMGTDNAGSSELTKTTRITNMFKKHSKDPVGSPFLSYTPSFEVSQTFGNQRNTAYFLDPRLIHFNMVSGYANEVEFLLPIASFPDDLAAVYSFDIHGKQNVKEFLKKNAIEKLDQTLGVGKGAAAFDKIQKNSTQYFAPVAKKNGKAIMADGNVGNFFKKTLGMPTPKVSELINAHTNLSCTDLIQLFWK